MMQVYGNQRGPNGPVKNQGPCPPRYMPFPANHRNQVPPVAHFHLQFLPPRPNFYPSPQTLVPPYSPGEYSFQGQVGISSAASVPPRLPPQVETPVNNSDPVVSSLLLSLMQRGVMSLKKQTRGGQEGTAGSLNYVPLVPQPKAAAHVPVLAPGLIDALLAKGVISLQKQSPVVKEEKDACVGCDFKGLDLNVRRESVLSGLYEGGLPRQCTSCGLRFKSQEEHSSHMDWHVKKNRMSKNRKQKPSRNYYATASMWVVTGDAEAEAVALFSGVDEKKRKCTDEEMAVPADVDQTKCAVCGDGFDEFYSHETEDWMYGGSVYLNAPQGAAPEMDRSQLGPIVHAKCSEGSRKRLRSTVNLAFQGSSAV